jgi:methyl-accepting chemotaxis protein
MIGLILLSVVIASGTILFLCSYFISEGFDAQALKEMELLVDQLQGSLDHLKNKALEASYSIASRPDVASAIEKNDTAYLQRISKEIMAKQKIHFITIADKDGKVVARGHSDKVGDSVLGQINVKKALVGEQTAGIEEGTVVKFSLRAGCPVKVGDKIVGSVTPGFDLSSSNDFVDEMKKRFGVENTIFHQDMRVTTTLVKDGQRATGSRMDNPKVIETVLTKGQKFIGRNVILGKEYNTTYWPIVCADGKIGGMLFIGRDRLALNKTYKGIIGSILLSAFLAGGLMVVLGFFLIRSVIRPVINHLGDILEGSNQVAAASLQVSSSSQSLAEGASEQAASIEETSSSIEEMTSMTRQNADHANQANALMGEAGQVTQEANRSMDELTRSMGEITSASEETGKIIKTIDEIAFQTNLLALNAAVEAARAGEAGAGFAVVADEVRNLALRAAEAAKNTSGLIEETVKKVKTGAELVSRTSEVFGKVAVSTKKVGELVAEIAAASKEQAQGIEQINRAVSEMDKVVQRNAASAEESASAAEEMTSQAEKMKVHVAGIVSLIKGGAGMIQGPDLNKQGGV